MPAFARVDEHGFTVHTCPSCGGASHPATGSAFTPTYVLCRRCAEDFARWVQRWTNAKGKRGRGHLDGVSFYEAAVSIGPALDACLERGPTSSGRAPP